MIDGYFTPGNRVHTVTEDGTKNGIVKALTTRRSKIWVVFNCAGDWNNFQRYGAQMANVSELQHGWATEKESA